MKLIPKKTQKNYATNTYALVFLISVIFVFFAYNLGRREYIIEELM